MININDTSHNETTFPIIDSSFVFSTALNDIFASNLSLSSCLSEPLSPTDTDTSLSSNNTHNEFQLVLSEKLDLLKSAESIIHAYIQENMISFSKPTFENDILEHVCCVLNTQLVHVIENTNERNSIIDTIAEDALTEYFKGAIPTRSIQPTTILHKVDVKTIRKQLTKLKNIPQPDQRTTEWYEFRYKYLTASSAWKALSQKDSATYNQIVYDKCKPLDVTKYTKSVSTTTPMHWGQKYEDVSIMWYENQYDTHVDDYGCLPHPTLSFLAASPDGINTSLGPRYGRMLEVKNIVNREITGIPKYEYWIQMQLQMEVCELDECDFLETRFKEYETEKEFLEDGTFTKTHDGKHKGIIMYFVKDQKPYYVYAPWQISQNDFNIWEASMMEKHKDLNWIQNLYWKLDEISCVLVVRNKEWFTAAKPKFQEVWNTIEKERKSGYEHRAPKKKMKKNDNKNKDGITTGKCFIHIQQMQTNKTTQNYVKNEKSEKKEKNAEPPAKKQKTLTISVSTEALKDAFIEL